MDEGALTYMKRSSLDAELVNQQQAAYRAAMRSSGAFVIDLPADDRFPDSTFVEDVLLAFPECFVLCRPGTLSREGEPELVVQHLPNDRPVMQIEAPATLDGGDVLQIGREVYVGLSSRTNGIAVVKLGEMLTRYGYSVTPIRVTGALHLKTAITAPLPDVILANPAWVDLAPFTNRRIVECDASEPFAGNTLTVGPQRYMQTTHSGTAARLRAAGVNVELLDISEFSNLEAGVTCMSVVVPQSS